MSIRLGSRHSTIRTRGVLSAKARRVTAGVTAGILVLGLAGSIELPRGEQAAPSTAAPPVIGELPERRTATSATRRNRDGSMTTTASSTPVHYRAPDGSWQPIDATLHASGGGRYAWRSGANAYEMSFTPVAGDEFAEFRLGGRTLRFDAVGARDGGAATVDGAQITYPGAFAGADLRYQVGATGVRKVIDISGPDSPASYAFRLSPVDGAGPLEARRGRDGSYQVVSGASSGFTLDAPVVWEGDDLTAAAGAKPALTVEQDGDGLVATLSLDRDWLRAPGRRFPVHLDPTITVQPHLRAATFKTVASAPGNPLWLQVGSDNTSTYRAGVLFDLSAVPVGAQVSAASMGLYFAQSCLIWNATPCAADHLMDVHRMTSAWTETSTFGQLTWDSTASGSYTLVRGAPYGWMTWPVTGLVSAWLDGTQPNYGVLIKRRTESLGSNGPSTQLSGDRTRLEVTYTLTGPYLNEPSTLHADGAELSWTPSATGTGTAGYEVHRAGVPTFTPGPATLIASVGDRSVTSYRDTTAAAGGTFSYKVKDLADSTVSVARTVTLPGGGFSAKVLQPGPADGQVTGIWEFDGYCPPNGGARPAFTVGSRTWDSEYFFNRGLLRFDLRDIPAGATVSGATLSLWRLANGAPGLQVRAHRATRPWLEGTSPGECGVPGATWAESEPGQNWTSVGGDHDTAVVGSATVPGADAGWDQFGITAAVQDWVSGNAPNHGLVLRVQDESLVAQASYAADDYSLPSLRPKLTVLYQDGSAAEGARVALGSPAAGSRVSGSVLFTAAAEDDRRVDRVDFKVNGNTVASDIAPPFEGTWNTVPGGNGTRTVTVQATDDAGNITVSPPVDVVVDNTLAPTVTLTAPASATGDVTLTATAADDVGVSSVAFLVDGVKVGEDVTSPYSLTWRTLDPLATVFNGVHQVTAMATDTSGQQVTTPAQAVTVNNRGTSVAKVDWVLNDPVSTVDDVFPPVMAENTATSVVQDPYASVSLNPDGTSGGSLNRALANAPVNDGGTPPGTCPATAYCPTIRVTNRSGVTWTSSTAQVWYRWYAPNGAILFEGRSPAAFPATFADGATQPFPVTIYPPALPPGVQQGAYRLRVDIYDPAAATWFAAKGNPPLDNPIIVAKALSTKLGFERFHQYEGEPLGAGMSTMTNVANGNMLWRWSPFFSPGRGLATMVDLTYNSLEDHSKSPAGNNVSLSLSGLIRLGEPMDIHPNKADEISGQSNKWVEFTDGDGSTHRFIGTTGTDGITRWTEPPGVNLYLRSLPAGDPKGRWALTRPDKVTFYFDVDGFPTLVEDRNGNRITFVLEDTPPGEDPGGPKKRITRVTDPSGSRSFVIDYWSKDEIKKAHVRGKIQQIRDHSGSRLDFLYYEDGNLRKIVQRGGANANGTPLADRSFVFTYTTSNGAGPAIPNAADRVDPAEKVPNQSTRLFSVRDPRGAETRFAYYQANEGQHLRWKLKTRTNRDGKTTTLSYDLTNRVTTVAAPLSRTTRYTYDVTGKVTRTVNPLNQNTDVEWSPDFKVTKVIEPTGRFTRYDYNANGYLTLSVNQLGEQTVLTYVNSPVDGNDVGNHLSQLDTVTRPRGVLTTTDPNDYRWRYTYDTAGNVDKVIDPTGAATDYDFNLAGSANSGTLAAVRDANGNPPTLYEAYDPSGQPTRIKDPLGKVTQIGYTLDGQVRWIQDPNHAGYTGGNERDYKSFFDYDEFGRLGRQSAPKSTAFERGKLLWSSVEYDANDNNVKTIGAHFGESSGDPEDGPVTTGTYDVMDRPVLMTGPDRSADPAGERTLFDYDDAGRLETLVKPRGMQSTTVAGDFTTRYGYDALDRLRHIADQGLDSTAAQTRHSHACYDLAGDLRSVTSPRAGLTSVTCPGDGPATTPFTSTFGYDLAHRQTSQKDPLGHETRIGYDPNGNVTSEESDIAAGRLARIQTEFNQRDVPELIRERFDGTVSREVVTKIEYDPNGNRKKIRTPRAVEAADAGQPAHYVTELGYDPLNRLTMVTLPFNGADGTERQYVHHSYDANGNLVWSSLPVTTSLATSVADSARTVMTYFDPGWIRTSDDPANPKVHFDHTAFGLQASRTPEKVGAPGQLDLSLRMLWTYYEDGITATRSDRGGQSSTYRYDAHNNLTIANDADGVGDPSQKPVDIEASYTGFDETAKTRFRRDGETGWTFSDYTYDANGNTTIRRENGQESTAGVQSKAPRRYEMTYDAADWLTTQLDLGTDSACKDDQRVVNTFWSTGWEKQRDIYRAGTGCVADPATWPKKQTTTWTHFDNGLLRKLDTVNPSGTVLESHDVGYVDSAGSYVNGNRTRDTYVLARGEGSTATTCLTPATACLATYTYDARDRLVNHQQRAGVTTTYTLDQPAQLIGDTTIRAGNVTTESKNGVTTTRRYQANQLTEATTAGVTAKYWYTPLGDLDCITTSAGSQANCSPPEGTTPSNLIADHTYDYLSRLIGTRQYSGGGTQTDEATYVYDPLDRTVTEKEDHLGTGKDRETAFAYQGMTGLLTEEKQTGGTDPKTKTYAYDAYGHRIAMSDTNAGGTTNTYTYGHDVHGSVSQLITDAGAVKASYGYDAYGGTDAPGGDAQSLTAGDTDAQAPLNPFRYTGKRIDSGQATSASSAAGYDMGARRYGPDLGRFLQQDMFGGALSELGLSLDPLTQNRYSLAGGNPIGYIEFDGHMAVADGGGGGSVSASPPPPPPPPPGKAESLLGGIFGGPGEKVGGWLDDLDRKTIYNPDSPWHTAYQTSTAIEAKIEQGIIDTATNAKDCVTGNMTGCEKLETGAEDLIGITDINKCLTDGDKGSCGWGAINFIPFGKLGKLFKWGDEAADAGRGGDELAGAACSFSGATLVLMADGTTKPIEEIKVGDEVVAADPETGERGTRTVTQVWAHRDELVTLELDGQVVTTTEDHPFWNDTDRQWQRADELGGGETVSTADGRRVRVHGIRPATTHSALAYNITVDDIHTYYVVAGGTSVLVHNAGPACTIPKPNITQHGLEHSFDRHAEQWFGRPVTKTDKLGEWQALIERASRSKQAFEWSSGTTLTHARLARIEGKWFVAQFDRSSGNLVTAFVPSNDQLSSMLRKLGK